MSAPHNRTSEGDEEVPCVYTVSLRKFQGVSY